jgi:hypothetical protein
VNTKSGLFAGSWHEKARLGRSQAVGLAVSKLSKSPAAGGGDLFKSLEPAYADEITRSAAEAEWKHQ